MASLLNANWMYCKTSGAPIGTEKTVPFPECRGKVYWCQALMSVEAIKCTAPVEMHALLQLSSVLAPAAAEGACSVDIHAF